MQLLTPVGTVETLVVCTGIIRSSFYLENQIATEYNRKPGIN
jgi:hypothetical protein